MFYCARPVLLQFWIEFFMPMVSVVTFGIVTQSPSQRLEDRRPTTLVLAGNLIFAEGGKPKNPEKKPGSQIEINQSQPTYEPRIEPRSQWWEARTMTTTPTWLPFQSKTCCFGRTCNFKECWLKWNESKQCGFQEMLSEKWLHVLAALLARGCKEWGLTKRSHTHDMRVSKSHRHKQWWFELSRNYSIYNVSKSD